GDSGERGGGRVRAAGKDGGGPPQPTFPGVCKTSIPPLRGTAVVEPEETAQSLTTLQRACSGHCRLCRDELVAQTLVWPFLVIMIDEFSDGRAEMPFAEQHHAIQALA